MTAKEFWIEKELSYGATQEQVDNIVGDGEEEYELMEEYAHQKNIEFGTWLHKNNWHPSTIDKWKNPSVKFESVEQWNDSFKTIEELYDIFDKEKQTD